MNDPLLQAMVAIAGDAGEVLLDAYRQEGLAVDWKDDASPRDRVCLLGALRSASLAHHQGTS